MVLLMQLIKHVIQESNIEDVTVLVLRKIQKAYAKVTFIINISVYQLMRKLLMNGARFSVWEMDLKSMMLVIQLLRKNTGDVNVIVLMFLIENV